MENENFESLYDREEDAAPDPCETCGGDGEVISGGWEYPNWVTCPDCKGTGANYDGQDEDLKTDRYREDGLL